MRIRDANATLNGDKTEFNLKSGALEIIAKDGRKLFGIELMKDGSIKVDAGHICAHAGKVFEDSLLVRPIASSRIQISRAEVKFPKGE